MVRTFICIELPPAIKQALGALQDRLRPLKADVGWTKPEGIHLTLKFLGDVPEAQIEAIGGAAAQAALGAAPFELVVGGTGAFPNARRPRVLWVGVVGDPAALVSLQKALDERLQGLGFEPEAREFRPHLTLGRVRSPRGVSQLMPEFEAANFTPYALRVDSITVMRSQLHPAGSIYTPLRLCPFREGL